MTCAFGKDTDQPGHSPSLIRVFAVRLKKPWVLNYPLSAQRRLCLDWVDAQADLSLRWVHRSFCRFCHGAAQICVVLLKFLVVKCLSIDIHVVMILAENITSNAMTFISFRLDNTRAIIFVVPHQEIVACG